LCRVPRPNRRYAVQTVAAAAGVRARRGSGIGPAPRSRREESAMQSTLTLVGNLVSDVTVRDTGRGVVASFRVAASNGWRDRTGAWVDRTTYLTVAAWRDLGENVAASLAKGQPVVVVGKPRQRSSTATPAGHGGGDRCRPRGLTTSTAGPRRSSAPVAARRPPSCCARWRRPATARGGARHPPRRLGGAGRAHRPRPRRGPGGVTPSGNVSG
jgi:single-strand DNA-binding protein